MAKDRKIHVKETSITVITLNETNYHGSNYPEFGVIENESKMLLFQMFK